MTTASRIVGGQRSPEDPEVESQSPVATSAAEEEEEATAAVGCPRRRRTPRRNRRRRRATVPGPRGSSGDELLPTAAMWRCKEHVRG